MLLTGLNPTFRSLLNWCFYRRPLIIIVGIWLGTIGAVHKDKPADHFTRIFAVIGYSLPTFWLGLMLLMLFYGLIGIFPARADIQCGKGCYIQS